MAKPNSGKRRPYQRDPYGDIRRNNRIRVPKIRVVGPDGKQFGVMDTKDALAIALDAGLDLVEVAGNAKPPVCRIMDFGKYIYEQQKKTKDNKGGSSKVKEVKFRPRVEQHDYMTKLRHAEEFLFKGNKVKLSLFFRGREMAYQDVGFETIKRAIKDLDEMGHPDSDPRMAGRTIIVMMSPLPANKRKPKFSHHLLEGKEPPAPPHEEDDHDEEDGEDDNDDGVEHESEDAGEEPSES